VELLNQNSPPISNCISHDIHGKDGVAGSIPAGGSTPRLTSANANQSPFWDCWGRPHLDRDAL
jgi:hypothetical protein